VIFGTENKERNMYVARVRERIYPTRAGQNREVKRKKKPGVAVSDVENTLTRAFPSLGNARFQYQRGTAIDFLADNIEKKTETKYRNIRIVAFSDLRDSDDKEKKYIGDFRDRRSPDEWKTGNSSNTPRSTCRALSRTRTRC
jgi:hypothetical protein